MCGIVAYCGSGNKAIDTVLECLKKLEYRGYDSSGIAYFKNHDIMIKKRKGKISNLEKIIEIEESNVSIGHTRWATHGKPVDENSHPHYSENRDVAIVHNGIIENYEKIRKDLLSEGVKFSSETDSEVISHLFSKLYDGDLLSTAKKVKEKLKGSYAITLMHKNHKDEILCLKKQSPLILALSENGIFACSDVSAILKYTNKVIYLEEDDIALIKKDNYLIINNDFKVNREIKILDLDYTKATKQGYSHFMIKEIEEQDEIIKNTTNIYDKEKLNDLLKNIDIEKIERVYIIACGTAYHAGLYAKWLFDKYLDKDVYCEIASEFIYTKTKIDENTLSIIISQSGETYDSLMALEYVKKLNSKTLAITNVLGSNLSVKADNVIFTLAGPEISVASTKAYTSQVLLLYLIILYFSNKENKEICKFLENIKKIKENKDEIKNMAYKLRDFKNGFYLGRSIDEKIAKEGSLKMKEISYIHTEAIASGELKHGSIALIDENMFSIIICTQKQNIEKTISTIKEIKARDGYVLFIGTEKLSEDGFLVEDIEDLSPLLAAIVLQYLAYYFALEKGLDIDMPRNLAKSVTVE